MKSSLCHLIPFLLILFNRLRLPSPKLNPILDNHSLRIWSFSLYSLRADPTENTFCCPILFLARLLIVACYIFERANFRWNAFTESLLSAGFIRHSIINYALRAIIIIHMFTTSAQQNTMSTKKTKKETKLFLRSIS
jgi:hypothetical protein